MKITSISDFRAAARASSQYPTYWLLADGGSLCHSCMRANGHRRLICEAILADDRWSEQWRPVALEVNWEDKDLACDHCYAPITSAYGGDDE